MRHDVLLQNVVKFDVFENRSAMYPWYNFTSLNPKV